MTLMKSRRIVLIFISLCLLSGCRESNSVEEEKTSKYNKSAKRGLAYNLINEEDIQVLAPGISWWYNWGINTGAPTGYYQNYEMEFIPMLWGGNTSVADIAVIKNVILAHPEIKYMLVLNEPNLTDQANRTPAQAAGDWLKYERIISDLAGQGRTIYLVGPAMNWGTMTGYSDPVVWMDAFIAAYKSANQNREPRIDYLAFHWYDYGLSGQLDRLKKYGKKIWITEMANWNVQINSYAKQKEQMREMVALCESRDDVFRYAWFIGRGSGSDSRFTYLLSNTPGQLNELGQYYLNLPFSK